MLSIRFKHTLGFTRYSILWGIIVFSSSKQNKNNLTKYEEFFVFGLWLEIISRLWKKSVGFLLPISSFLHVISDAVILDPSEKKTSDFQENIWHPLFNASSLHIFSTILSPSRASYSLCRQTVEIVSEKVSGKEFDIKRERRFVHDCLHLKFLCTFYRWVWSSSPSPPSTSPSLSPQSFTSSSSPPPSSPLSSPPPSTSLSPLSTTQGQRSVCL